MNQMLELSGKDFEAAIIRMLQQAIKNALEINKKYKISAKKQKVIRKNQMSIIELTNTITKMKKLTGWIQ